MERYGFLVDLNYCNSCRACEIACKTRHDLPTDRNIRWRRVVDVVYGSGANVNGYSVSLACNHCENAACARACPNGAITMRADGIVLHDRSKCAGCGYCKAACPYGAPQHDAIDNKMSKCSMCFDRIDQGKVPACADTCPTGALSWGPLSEIEWRGIAQLRDLPDPRYTRPSVRFITRED